jgi:Thioesterase-like superfamily
MITLNRRQQGHAVTAEPIANSSPSGPADPEAAPGAGEAPAADSAEGFFAADGDALIPADFASSPWGAVLHGRLIGGLTARAVEQAHAGDPDLMCSRLTIDMFRSAPLAPVRVTARPVRSGRRIAVLEVTVENDDGPVGQGKAVLLRRSQQPEGTFRPTPPWNVPTPLELGPPPAPAAAARRWSPPWQSWNIGPSGSMTGALRAGLWIRETHPLVTGEQLTPLVRLSMAADLASPVSNASDRGLDFINADYTIYLGRDPQGEYVGIQPYGHVSERGVAVGQCVVHDLQGAVGFVATTAVANSMARPPAGG